MPSEGKGEKENGRMAKRGRRRRRKGSKKEPPQQKEEALPIKWMDEEGLHVMKEGEEPSEEELAEMTKEYQRQIRKSPMWKDMVKIYGREQAEEVLKGFRVELR